MKYFFAKLIAPRPSFAIDMSDTERAVMMQHVGYWNSWTEKGNVVAFGPVAAAEGGFGIAIIQVENPDELGPMIDNDPVMLSGLGFRYEVAPMPRLARGAR